MCRKVFQGILSTLVQEYQTGGHDVLQQVRIKVKYPD